MGLGDQIIQVVERQQPTSPLGWQSLLCLARERGRPQVELVEACYSLRYAEQEALRVEKGEGEELAHLLLNVGVRASVVCPLR